MTTKQSANSTLQQQLVEHMGFIKQCTLETPRHGRLLLATPAVNRYPYVYPRDVNCASQLFRRLAGSQNEYEVGETAFEYLASMAKFFRDVQSDEGGWGQRYDTDGEDKSVYKQEDNIAHGISIISNYLLLARHLGRDVENLDGYLESIDAALDHASTSYYHKEINLFESTTAIHESAMEEGFTIWVNFSFLYAFSLANEVATKIDHSNKISKTHLSFREYFLHSVSELFMAGSRYVRRLDPKGGMDPRPDITLLSPFYYGFHHYDTEMENSVAFLEKQLWDAEFGMIMRYLPFNKDFSVHIHAGNGPWMQYTAILAQYHYWRGRTDRGDQLLASIDRYRGNNGEIPEHLSTCARFESFMRDEWKTGVDFEKEFYKPLLLDNVDFDKILEEANNMAKSYEETGKKCMIIDSSQAEGGYIQFAMPLMWSHVEYSRALLVKHQDWWRLGG